MNYQVLFVIVERGRAQEVIQAAQEAGADGATVLTGRGASIHEKKTLFSLNIEPEKEICLFVAPTDQMSLIVDTIQTKIEIQKPGNGILFALDIESPEGIHELLA